jgi:hypothetical protein
MYRTDTAYRNAPLFYNDIMGFFLSACPILFFLQFNIFEIYSCFKIFLHNLFLQYLATVNNVLSRDLMFKNRSKDTHYRDCSCC